MTKKRKFIPSIVVRSDDLVVTDEEGNEHKPHEGEWVRFRSGVSLGTVRQMNRASRLADLGDTMTPELAAEVDDILAGVLGALEHQIIDWSWTDADWQPLPRPKDGQPFRDALANLENYEMAWLQAHYSDGANVSKN